MYIQPEILCAGVPGQLLDHGTVPGLPGVKYLMEGIVDTDILSPCSLNEQW